MIKKLMSLAMGVTLVCCLAANSTFGRTGAEPKEPLEKPPAEKTQANEKLKADFSKLLADARAGKVKMPVQSFPQPKRNNWSKKATIGVIAAIAGTIVAIVICNKLTSDND